MPVWTSIGGTPTYIETRGAFIVGFVFAHMLGFELMSGLENFGSVKLYW
ncbi:hypothetical protein ACFQ3Z_44420 [Streptomyces nogalater]